MTLETKIHSGRPLRGACRVPGDKSISHRAVMLAAMARGKSRIMNFLDSGDCRATVDLLKALGIRIETPNPFEMIVTGSGHRGFSAPPGPLDCGNSGTTMRLMAGILSGQRFDSVLDGTPQLRQRPMGRIIKPLGLMGVPIESRDGKAPLHVKPSRCTHERPQGIEYAMPVASAQLKSCILLAGLFAQGATAILEPGPTRDHTERMLRAMGVKIQAEKKRIVLEPSHQPLEPIGVTVPGDISSAAFFLVAGSIVPGSDIFIESVGINPTRTGIVKALGRMGASIMIENRRESSGELLADITVSHSNLVGATFKGSEIVTMIDELPVLAVAAAFAQGDTVIRDARELRVKETDRIATTALELSKLGVKIEELEDGMIISGGRPLSGTRVSSHGDHRLAMLLAVAGLAVDGETVVEQSHVTADSFPGFEQLLSSLGAHVETS